MRDIGQEILTGLHELKQGKVGRVISPMQALDASLSTPFREGSQGCKCMIPPFNDDGYLPPGIHAAILDEIEQRFGRESEMRQAEMDSLRWLVDLARRARASRLIVNGSFVTDTFEPNDIDCVLLIEQGYPHDDQADAEIREGLPFLQCNRLYQDDFDVMVNRVYGFDRRRIPKGVIEVVGWQ